MEMKRRRPIAEIPDTALRPASATGAGSAAPQPPDSPSRSARADVTREKILRAAFLEFYRNGFQGGSLNRIVESAGITKGALFHHFEGKQDLGYAVVDEVIGPLLSTRWLTPVLETDDPIPAIGEAFERYVRTDVESGHWLLGCPLNNLAQEMSPLDVGFAARINGLYESWRETYSSALRRGQRAGRVRGSVDPESVAALIVAGQMGIWGTGKSSQSPELMLRATGAISDYLDSLKP